MRFLRMLSNALLAGALAAAYLTLLVLHLNPEFPLSPRALLPLVSTMVLAYGSVVALGSYVLVVLHQIVAPEVLSPGWLSVRLLSWLCTMVAAGAAVVMWLNVRGFAPTLDAPTIRHLTTTAVMLTAAATVFLLIALAHLGRRGSAWSGAALVLTMALSLAAPLAVRGEAALPAARLPLAAGPAEPRPEGRIQLLMLDGASLEVISPAVAESRLPNFGRMLDGGAVLHLATIRPTQAEPVWSAVATGRAPMANGIRSAALYRARSGHPPLALLPDYCFAQALVRFGFLAEEPHAPDSLRAPPLWRLLSDVGIPVAVIGWPVTHPAPAVNGLLLSDVFHTVAGEMAEEAVAGVFPRDRLQEVTAALAHPAVADPPALVPGGARSASGAANGRHDPAPLLADRIHLQLFAALDRFDPARFTAVRFPGVDAVGHSYLRYADPTSFGDVSEDERRRLGRVLEDYYGFLDTVVGRALDRVGPHDLLLVVSGFGMQPLSPGKRLLEWLVGNPAISGSHERAPDGFLLAFGPAVEPGRARRGSVLDVAPTVLYYLGLPVGRDMEGFARTDIFRDAFTSTHPITFVPAYGH